MSGRELAVDRSVVFDLNRHLRNAASYDRPADDHDRSYPARPDTSILIEAVSRAATSLSTRDDRIRQLEDRQVEAEDLIERMKSKLADLLRLQQATDAKARSELERADRAEATAARLQSRVQQVEGDLDAALTDLHRIADVITGSLLTADRR